MGKSKAFIGVDDGAYSIKVALGGRKNIRVNSTGKAGRLRSLAINDAEVSSFEYKTCGDSSFVVGDVKDPLPTAHDQYQTSELNRILIHHALHTAGCSGQKVRICTTLPLKSFYKEDFSVNSKLVNLKKANIKNMTVTSKLKSKSEIKIDTVDVLPEGLAAFFNLIIEEKDGSLSMNLDLLSKRIAVADIGGNTLDNCVIEEGTVITAETHSRKGMLMVGKELTKLINLSYSIKSNLRDVRKCIESPQNGVYTYNIQGSPIDVTSHVKEALTTVSSQIIGLMQDDFGDFDDYAAIYLVGGGSLALELYLKEATVGYRNFVFAENPQYANAEGMRKYCAMNSAAG